MKTSDQIKTGQAKTRGQAVAKRFAKSDSRYWHDAIFKPTYTRDGETFALEDWAARIQWRGRRELFNLRTPNRAAAATKARDIYTLLAGSGWDAALAKYKPEMQRRNVSKVGDLLCELRQHWSGKAKTFEDYSRSFRSIVSQVFGIDGARAKYDSVNGGRDAWAAKVDAIRLADISPAAINKWRIAFVKRAGSNPLEQKRARITCNSLMRQAKSLFSPELITHVTLHRPETLPFDGVDFYPRESMRYHSTVDIESLVREAMGELASEPLKIFLLATMVGLRRNEIDKLEWSAFHWNDRLVRIGTTEHFAPKTQDSGGDIPIDEELVALFRGWQATASGTFVIEADSEPRSDSTYTHYRAARHFADLVAWLRDKGVSAPKPLHELRKEFGSQLCAKYGIYTASRMLRHSDIGITAQHYLDQKERVTIGFGNLLAPAANVVPLKKLNRASKPAQAVSA